MRWTTRHDFEPISSRPADWLANHDEAGQTFKQLFDKAPEHDNKMRLRAFEAFQKAAEADPKLAEIHLAIALICLELKKFDEALAAVELELKLVPESKAALEAKAKIEAAKATLSP